MLAGWMVADALACDVGTSADPVDLLVWPLADPIPAQTVLVVHRFGSGEVGPLKVLTPARVEVPVLRTDLSGTWSVLQPVDPLIVGTTYTLVASTLYSDAEFTVSDTTVGPLAMTTPIERVAISEAVRQEPDCSDTAVTSTSLTYTLCDPAAVVVVTTGDAPPPVPSTLADLPSLGAVSSGNTVTLPSGLVADGAQTVWLGSFDGVGRFQGWFVDDVVMPPPGTVRVERAGDCVEWDGWQVLSDTTCDLWDETLSSCIPVQDDPQTDPSGCGCGTSSGSSWLGWLALAGLRRRQR